MSKSKTQKYYDSHPEAKKKKAAYDTKYHATPERKKYRAKLNKINRDRGTYGSGDGLDASHTKSGKIVMEKASTNRARNGGGRDRKPKSTKK